jgi:hypothetical protein
LVEELADIPEEKPVNGEPVYNIKKTIKVMRSLGAIMEVYWKFGKTLTLPKLKKILNGYG